MVFARLSLLVAIAVVLAGCGLWTTALPGVDRVCESAIETPPCGRGAEQDAAYSFLLLTHCGVEWAYFDGRYWVPREAVDTPPDWSGVTKGAMTLDARDVAVFRSGSTEIPFVPAPESYRPPPCA